mgnify:CR=1 FL=1
MLTSAKASFAQLNVSGYVLDENNAPIAYANIFIRELGTGTSTDINGRYFTTLQTGEYTFTFSSVGYETQTVSIILKDVDVVKNIWLKPSTEQLNEIVVKARRRDPAYEIIQNAIDNKAKYLFQVNTLRNNVYLKAAEISEQKSKEKREPIISFGLGGEEPPDDLTSEEDTAVTNQVGLIEIELQLNFQSPDRYKEERTAFNKYGNTVGLFIPRFDEIDFNFYKNLVYLKGITETPIISPLSNTSILTYKFKLENSYKEGEQTVYRIRVTPRKKGNSSCSGYIYINDGLWNINKVEVELYKGSLRLYDAFSISQTYCQVRDSLWFPCRQEFIYETKQNRLKTFKGSTLIRHSDYDIDYIYPEKFFGNEIAFTAQDAYDKDSGYWSQIRPEPLTIDEQKMVRHTDSIRAITQSPEYLDSIDALFNKVTALEIFYEGVAFRKSEKRYMYFSSIPSMIGFQVAGGWRFGPYFYYYKRNKSGKSISFQSNLNYGFKNNDLQGGTGFRVRYNPFKFADFWVYTGRDFHSINYFDAYLNQLSFSNYILADMLQVGHRIELVNGLFLYTEAELIARQSLANFNGRTFLNDLIGEREPLEFEDYEALITDIRLSYTPGMRYMTEPDRKILVGTRYPTFTIRHKKGWENLLGSDINFDYLSFSISQKMQLGIFGASNYVANVGTFVNTKGLEFIDYKRFRQSDPYLYSNPLYSFQLLDTSLSISSLFFEAHYIHHFNGAIINNVPLLKKTRIMAVAGGGALWVSDPQYRYAEVFAGVERTFKLGARRRLKVGLYGVIGESNQIRTTPGYKISLDIIDTWKRNWSF